MPVPAEPACIHHHARAAAPGSVQAAYPRPRYNSRRGEHDQQRGDKYGHHGARGRSAAAATSLSRSSRRRIFSALLFGNSSRNSIDRGIL